MNRFGLSESLHRLMKQAIDSGAATSVTEAEAMFRSYQIAFAIGSGEARNACHQAALLTGVALARRVFLGGVSVTGDLDVPMLTPLPLVATLGEAVKKLGGVPTTSESIVPRVTIGGGPQKRADGFHVRTLSSGWRGGIVPAHAELAPEPGSDMPLAAMLSAALAINEAFMFVGREFTPDSRVLVLGLGHEFRFHDLASKELVLRIRCDVAMHPGYIAFAPAAGLMALELAPGVVHLKEIATGRTVARLEDPHGDRAGWLSLASDGGRLAVVSQYARAVHVWDLRAIRGRLKTMNLDWDWPEFPTESK